jgi:Tol biopolymer transport system component
MGSLIIGYEYDIFISYRHNDNRSGWVTDFVNALQEELAATIKEPLTIYFDKNPHDGLLETHDVDGSLKEKIKCLVFIPIISQTYCDPKSFAWKQEFLPFLEFCKQDQFGLDIKLGNGNVTKRILPIRIHEIDEADKNLFGGAIGGVMRPIDFIYRSSGVNRSLVSSDSRELNQYKTQYRDQINKVANTIKDLLNGLINYESIKAGSFVNPPVARKPWPVESESNYDSTEPITATKHAGNTLPILKIVGVIIISSLVTALTLWKYFNANDKKDTEEAMRFSVLPPTATSIELIGDATLGAGRRSIDISLSGNRIVFIGNHNGRPNIFVRDMNDFNAKVIPQTEGAYACTLSPDASEVAYFVGNSLRKIKIDGGSPVSLAEVANPTDVVWVNESTLYFGADEGANLYKYSQKAELIRTGWWFNTLSHVPGTDYLLISSYYNKIGLYNTKSDSVIDLDLPGTSAKYLNNGSITFMRGSTLLIVPFDITQQKVLSEPKEILTCVRLEHLGAGQFSVSREGTIIYIAGEDTYIGGFVWVDRNGKTEPVSFSKENYGTFRLSPDQSKIAVPIYSTTNDLWVLDISSSKKMRVTSTGRSDFPLWRDNNSIYVRIDSNVYLVSSTQNTNPELVIKNANPESISADGQFLVVTRDVDVFLLNTKTKELIPITNTPNLEEFHASISPDGSLIAYTRSDSRAYHVFVKQAVSDGNLVQISDTEGAEEPRWTADGKRIIYRSGQQWMEVEIKNAETLEVTKPKLIAEGDYINIDGFSFDLSIDGQKLLMVKGSEQKTASEIRVIKNWFKELSPKGEK